MGAPFPSDQLPENNVRLACVKHLAGVPSEPGSNSDFDHWALTDEVVEPSNGN
jgi:hypothetical protein